MQRSRKALQQRRAVLQKSTIMSGKEHLYKVSVSVVVISWILIFLLNCLISQSDGYGDADEPAVASVESVPQNAQPDKDTKIESSVDIPTINEMITNSDQELVKPEAETSVKPEAETSVKPEAETVVKPEVETFVNEEDTLVGVKPEILSAAEDLRPDNVFESGKVLEKDPSQKNDRLSRITTPGLDEFKTKAISSKEKTMSNQANTVIHRVEPGGKEYNYAAASKGAKVLAFNKEAKGAANILDKDKDKYLRNPCSVEGKYVVIELSEETLVDTIEIANFEHYSSNLKAFEIYGSLEYPTDKWVKLGNFTAANAKHPQRFRLEEPKWGRYLKLNLLSHYGSEFFCTLSSLEVYGVDVVERMLEDMISVEKKPEKQIEEPIAMQEPIVRQDPFEELLTEVNDDQSVKKETSKSTDQSVKKEPAKSTVSDSVSETRPLQVGRMPGDTVLKLLMQKVQSLDTNFSVLERYLEELNSRYGRIFKDFDDDITKKERLLEKIKLEIKNLQQSKDTMANELSDLLSWKTYVTVQLDRLAKDNLDLRSEVRDVRDHQVSMENRGLAVIFVCFIFGCLAITKLFTDFLLTICKVCKFEKFCWRNSGWLLLLLGSSIIASILILP